ncbi:MAG: hypothetical protein ABEJ88_08990 [Halobacterium sp.]
MRRRGVLAGVVAVATAGCLGSGRGGGSPSVAGTDFSVVDAGCGVVREAASVSFGGGVVRVAGKTSAPSGCYTARLASAAYDRESGELRVLVAAERREDAAGCVQCITEIDYEAAVRFDGGLPASVVVVHRSRGGERTVASVER